MAEGVIVKIDGSGPALVAFVKAEKVAAREAQILESDVKAGAPSKRWRVIVDMSDVTMLASMGLGALVTLHKACAAGGGQLVICGMRDELMALLKVTHLDRILKIVKTRGDADKLLA